MKKLIFLATALLLSQAVFPQSNITVIKGATIISTGDNGKDKQDIPNSYIILEGDEIIEVGSLADRKKFPRKAKIIKAKGKYIVPGLIDGFAAINNQKYANAYLYMGVTSIISVDGFRRGPFFGEGNPAPHIYRLDGVGEERTTDEELLVAIEEKREKGIKVLLIMYGLTPNQIALSMKKAEEYGMATIGELGFTSYLQGMKLGVNAFVHTTRYSLDIAPHNMALAVAFHPFSNDLNSAKWKYYNFLTHLEEGYQPLIDHAKNLGNSNSYIFPTSSLSYLDIPSHSNPWDEPIAKTLDVKDINRPADKITGNHSIDSVEQAAYTNLILNELKVIEPTYYKHGAKYLTGSATDVWGTMPGISLHTEFETLTKIGLKSREVIAAATENFSKAFGWKIGKIEKGYRADLLILNHNPLEDLKNLKDIDVLIQKGKVIDRAGMLK